MPDDLLEQLTKSEVPPVPESLDRQVHRRLNRTLLVIHILDFVLRGIPYAALQLARAVMGLVAFSLTGAFPGRRSKDA